MMYVVAMQLQSVFFEIAAGFAHKKLFQPSDELKYDQKVINIGRSSNLHIMCVVITTKTMECLTHDSSYSCHIITPKLTE